jgi:hypothetical protein
LGKIWNKTIADNKTSFDHLQEHKNGFANIISENCKNKILKPHSKLGFDYEGKTEALQHISKIDPIRNLFMYNHEINGLKPISRYALCWQRNILLCQHGRWNT